MTKRIRLASADTGSWPEVECEGGVTDDIGPEAVTIELELGFTCSTERTDGGMANRVGELAIRRHRTGELGAFEQRVGRRSSAASGPAST